MPISVQVPFNGYTGNGSSKTFPYTFKILEASNLKVYKDGVLQTIGYTVTGVGNSAGGNVNFTAAPANGSVVELKRVTPLDRSTDYQTSGALEADTLDADFDRLVMQIQDLQQNSLTPLWETVANTPTTLSGYGITNAYTKSEVDAKNWNWSSIQYTPTTLAGYGITDAASSTHNHDGSYATTSHSHTFASLTSTPTTLAGYGITDAASSTHNHTGVYQPVGSYLTANQSITLSGDATGSGSTAITVTLANTGTSGTYTKVTTDSKGRVSSGTTLSASDIPSLDWTKITTGKPTTLAGYGITDAQPVDGDLTAIAGLAGTSGLARKTAANTWSLDTATYLTANQSISLTGDATGSGTTSIAVTLNTVPVSKGGTGQTTATAAFNALAPTQTGNSGKFLTTNGTTTSWATVAGGGGATILDDLTDVVITTPSNGQALVYNGTSWVNQTTSGSGDVLGPSSTTDNAVVRFDGTTGKLIQDSHASISDTGFLSVDDGFNINLVSNSVAGTISLIASAGNVNAGAHYYWVSFITAAGETQLFRTSPNSVTTTGGSGQVTVGLPISPDYRVTGRKVYRSRVGDPNYAAYPLATINDNTTTTYVDNIADASLVTTTNYYWLENNTASGFKIDGSPAMLIGNSAEPSLFLGKNAGLGYFNGTSFGGANVGLGPSALDSLTTGSKNNAIGYSALTALTTGGQNTALGWGAGMNTSTGSNNLYIGHDTGYYNQTGSNNTGVGYMSLFGASGQSNSYNTALGAEAGYNITTGSNNILIGRRAGFALTSGSNNVVIGYNVEAPSNTSSNQLNIGNLIFGTSVDGQGTTLSTGNIGIGITNPTEKLDIVGNIKVSGTASVGGYAFADLLKFDMTFEIQTGADATFTINEYAGFKFTINSARFKTDSGTISAAVKINGTNVTGLSALSLSSTQGSATATATNTVNAGQRVTVVTSSDASAVNAVITLACTRVV